MKNILTLLFMVLLPIMLVSTHAMALTFGNSIAEMAESVQTLPEPAAMAIFGAALLGVAGLERKKFVKK